MTSQESNQPSLAARIGQATVTSLRQWWDSDHHPETSEVVRAQPDSVAWKRCMAFVIVHVGCLLAFLVECNWAVIIATVLLYYVRMFAITAFYHRYFSHRSFKAGRAMQFIMAAWGNTAMQRGALWWASVHRHHHKHSDDEHDVHSPRQFGFLWSHIGWLTSQRNFPTDYSRVKDLAKFPELVFLNRHDQVIPILYGLMLWGVGVLFEKFAPGVGLTGGNLFVWGFFVSTALLLHGTFFINSLAHVFGRRRFKTDDDSRNSMTLAIMTMGEGWHNNHHRYMHSARQGFYWWEWDPSFYILKMMSWVGLVRDLKGVPETVYVEAKNGGVPTSKPDTIAAPSEMESAETVGSM